MFWRSMLPASSNEGSTVKLIPCSKFDELLKGNDVDRRGEDYRVWPFQLLVATL
jgi:hypothetical protein